MKEEKNNIIYSAEFIRKYLDGELTDQEMQALEKAALEDPFLSDAIEGMEESRRHPVSFESGLEDLEKKLEDRIGRRDRKTGMVLLFSKWKIAAAVIFILGMTIFTYTYLKTKGRDELAHTVKKDSTKGNPVPAPVNVTTDTTGISTDQKNQIYAGSDTGGNTATADAENKSPATENVFRKGRKRSNTASGKNTEKTAASDSGLSALAEAESVDDIQHEKKDIQPAPVSKAVSIQPRDKSTGLETTGSKTSPENFVSGVVTDDKGNPLPYTTVKFKGSEKGTYTDSNGLFKMHTKDPNLAELEFVHSGYESASLELLPNSTFTNKVRMREIQSSSSEVAVTGKPDAVKSKKSPGAFYQNVHGNEPATVLGWEAFNSYLNKNKKINSPDSLRKGEEIVSFILHSDGILSSFKVEKSISPAHDSLVLGMIRSAPALKLLQGKKQQCFVSISFP